MRIAAFNVENLFDRAKVLNLENDARTSAVLKAASEINILFEKPDYSAADKARMLVLLDELGLLKSDKGEFALLRVIRGKIIKRGKNKPPEIVAAGRASWIGWVELRTEPVDANAVANTGRVIRDVDADILAVIEAEGRIELKLFSEIVLRKVNGEAYDEVMVIDGNDDRGIDVGLLTKRGCVIGLMRSHIHEKMANQEPVFSRDCPEYAVTTPSGEIIWVLPNHFKSKFGGDDPRARAKREAQGRRVAEIYNQLREEGHDNIVVLGDLNDTPASPAVKLLLDGTDLKDVSDHASFDTGAFAGRGTFGLGNDNQKIDYLLLSPALFGRVTASGLFRKGAWPGARPPRWEVYPEITEEHHVASDHHVIWADIDI
jgi:endonuclease/exonuclease/phosphatase family metal-dependent hydrolase